MCSRTYFMALLLVYLFSSILNSQTPMIKWWFDTKSFSAGQTAAADIDGDGKLELVFGCYRNDGGIYALNSEDGTLLWSYFPHTPPREGCNDVAPVIYDVDGDSKLDVVVPCSCTNVTICLNGKTGDLKWKTITRGSDSPPTIADLDGNGKSEILHGEFLGWVRCLNGANGSTLWELPVNMNSWIQTAPTIVDLNNDGQLDFVVGTWEFSKKDSIYAFDGKTRKNLWKKPIHNWMYHGTSVADFDNDNKPELLIGSYNDTLYCINGENGSTEWKYFADGSSIGGPPVIGDIDNDGKCEVVFSSWYKVIALSDKGALKWKYNIPSFTYNFRGMVLSDINNDAYTDVLFGTKAGEFIALNGKDGKQIFRMDMAAHYGNSLFDINHAPVIADFDKDGTLDAFFVGGYGEYPAIEKGFGRAYMVTIGKGNGPEWLMFQRDVRRQSSMCFDYLSAEKSSDPDLFSDLEIFPNPTFSDFTINCGDEVLHISVFDLNGSIFQEIKDCKGPQTLNIDKKGVFIIKLSKKGFYTYRKLIIY
ncbi:MAG: FG-GAP-like repeat-containing protein [Deltaproteobacteria bacterium]